MPRLLAIAAAAHLAASCDRLPAVPDGSPPPAAVTLGATPPECLQGEAHPATGAPAEGLWLYEDLAARHRVAAIIGPAQSAPGASQLTRRIETLEALADADTIRFSSDTASVRLEFIPPSARPAAVYSIGSLVWLASYEPCDAGQRQPLIRYLRQHADGRVATDVLLQREVRP